EFRRVPFRSQAARGGELPAFAEVVVEEQAGPDHPRGAQVRPMWQHEAHRLDQVWRLGQQHFAFGQRFADQAELVMFEVAQPSVEDRKSTRLNSSHVKISYAVFCLKKKNKSS